MRIFNLKTDKIFKLGLIFIFGIIFCQSISSQFYWQKTYHATPDGDEEAFDICEADNNNYYIAGITAPFFRKAYVIKINEFGDTLWTRTYFDGEIYTVAPTIDGGCIFAGYSGQAFACRINSMGDTIWLKFYNTINFQDIKKAPDGNYVLCGSNYSSGQYNGYACEIDTNGSLLWEKIYSSATAIDLFALEIALDNGFILCGTKRGTGGIFRSSYIIKIDSSGEMIWDKTYFLNTADIVSGINTCNSGYILTGSSNGKLYLLKINFSGDSNSLLIFNNTNNVGTTSILKVNNNKFYISHRNGIVGNESVIYNVDSNLNVRKQISLFNNEGINLLSSIKVQNSIINDIIFVGITAFEPGNEEAYALRIDSSLTQPPPIGIINISNNIHTDYILNQNYPNPFNNSTIFYYSLKKSGNVVIKIYDIEGKLINELNNGIKAAGVYSVNFNNNNLASGIYFYSLEANGFKDTKKMVLIK